MIKLQILPITIIKTMKYEEKFQGCIAGISAGESLGINYPEWATPGLCSGLSGVVLDSLVLNGTDAQKFLVSYRELMSMWYASAQDYESFGDLDRIVRGDQAGPFAFDPNVVVRCLPIGLYWMDNIPMVVEYSLSMSQITHPATVSLCSSVAGALMVTMAAQDVPTGLWGHEVLSVVSGIDKYFENCIKRAASAAASKLPPNVAFSDKGLGTGKNSAESVMAALYCCMLFPKQPEMAIRASASIPENASFCASITGACLGAAHGIKFIEKILPQGLDWTIDTEKEQALRLWESGAERIKKNVRRDGLG